MRLRAVFTEKNKNFGSKIKENAKNRSILRCEDKINTKRLTSFGVNAVLCQKSYGEIFLRKRPFLRGTDEY